MAERPTSLNLEPGERGTTGGDISSCNSVDKIKSLGMEVTWLWSQNMLLAELRLNPGLAPTLDSRIFLKCFHWKI